ncbi:asparaginase [Thermoflexibacter ruber]|uniref:asparaginase n=1 Tax=Thermoflexibacter ruber TaxID=1003 RepID=A0A1I2JCQ3_9BACT|nr:asparaginase [Thermoflexibacter ruber]SFF50461.1 asparaginase [Thermoflexibacter ruber]
MLNYYPTINIKTASVGSSDTSIFVIYTGGTIGMDYDKTHKHLKPLDFKYIIDKVPELRRFDFELTVLSLNEPIDSSNVQPHHWLNIGRMIYDFYNDYDAFVILHGTDTMAYSASALSYLLENLDKPVIFTGAQLPIGVTRTDARENFISALEIASTKNESGKALVPEVCIFFDHLLLRGNRSRKVQSFNFTAFKSQNCPPLAVAGIHIDYNKQLILPQPNEPFWFYNRMDSNVIIVKLYPGLSNAYLDHILHTPHLRGVVLETYGSGNAPSNDEFIGILKNAIDRGIVIYNVSQCNGGVIQGLYETSKKLAEIGVISGGDITPEAAITKLMFLLGNESDNQVIRQKLEVSIRGEITEHK